MQSQVVGVSDEPFLFLDLQTHTPEFFVVEASDQKHFILRTPQGSDVVRLRKRTAYPGTYLKQPSSRHFVIGYGSAQKRSDREFLEITLSPDGFCITRDQFATLPLFFALEGGHLIMSNQYKSVVAALSNAALSRSGLVERLAVRKHTARLYTESVQPLREREILRFDGQKLILVPPPDRAWPISKDAPGHRPQEFLKKFTEYMEYFITTRLDGQNFGFEVSGGLDSATLPQYYARTRGKTRPSSTIRFLDNDRMTQHQKLQALKRKTSLQEHIFEPDPLEQYPLASMVTTSVFRPKLPETTYDEAFSPLLNRLQGHGIDMLVTGHGADELFGNIANPALQIAYGEVERQERQRQSLPRFFTDKFRDVYVTCTPQTPFMPLPFRPLSIANGREASNKYIQRDIWPVSPFVDASLYEWCQGLPAYARSNKNILRAYHEAYGFVPEVYQPYTNESFSPLFCIAFQSGTYDHLMQKLLEYSVTVQQGLIDPVLLLQDYEGGKQESMSYAEATFYDVYLWMVAEINAQYSGFQRLEA